MSLCWIVHWCSSSLSDLHCLPVSFNERAKETFPSCFCDYMHTLICVCVTVFTCNEKVFALSLCIRMMWFVHTCGGLCACVFEVMLGTGIKNRNLFDETVQNQNTHDHTLLTDCLWHKLDKKQLWISGKDAKKALYLVSHCCHKAPLKLSLGFLSSYSNNF